MLGPNPLGPILISVLKLGSNVTKRCITNKMVSAIREQGQNEVLRLQEQNHYTDYLHLGSSAYSLFILAIRAPQTKQKYLQRFGYFLDFAQVVTEKGTSIEERCNKLAELANNDYKWLLNRIFNYLQLLRLSLMPLRLHTLKYLKVLGKISTV